MAQALTTTTKTLEAASAEVHALVVALCGDLENSAGQHTLTRLPTKDQRDLLQARFRDLREHLRPVGYTAHGPALGLAGAAIAEMFADFPNFNPMPDSRDASGEPDGRKKAIGWYVGKLKDYPLFAVQLACKDIGDGRTEANPDFVPSVPRLAQLCRQYQEAALREQSTIKLLLEVERTRDVVFNDDPRVGEGLRNLSAELKSRIEEEDAEERERRTAETIANTERLIRREWDAKGEKPKMVLGKPASPALAAIVSQWREQDKRIDHTDRNHRDQGS